MKFSVQYFEK